MTISATPTLQGFKEWVRLFMAVPTSVLPDDSVWFSWAYEVSLAIVNPQLAVAAGPLYPGLPPIAFPGGATPIYALAVYNLGGDNLVNWVVDDPELEPPLNTYWSDLRAKWNINGFVGGVIQSSADESTSQSMVVPEQFKDFTVGNLQNLKTPWGRQYLAFAQSVGTLWGLS